MSLRRLLHLHATGVAIWNLAWQLLGDRNGWLALLNAWSFWILSSGTLAGILAWLPRRPGLAAAIGGLGAAHLIRHTPWMTAPLRRHPPRPRGPLAATPGSATQPPSENGAPLSLFSMNLLHRPRPLTPLLHLLAERRPTLALFQEAIPSLAGQLDRELAPLYPYRTWIPDRARNMGLGIMARVPFAVTGLWRHPDFEAHALRVTVPMEALGLENPGELDVYSVHFVSPINDVRIHGFTRLLRIREAQIRQILDEVHRRGRPALLAGDWNTTESTRAYRMATQTLQDAWLQAGRGPGWTWPCSAIPLADLAIPPLLRLDYLFLTGRHQGPALHVQAMEVIRGPFGSDHAALWAELRVEWPAAPDIVPPGQRGTRPRPAR